MATARAISCLDELKPGDHIQVLFAGIFHHHMLVVETVDDSTIRVVHNSKQKNRVVEENLPYRPEDITVLDYACNYTGQEIVERARARIGEPYQLLLNNCEHFAYEVRTGTAQSKQLQNAALVGTAAALGIGLGAAAHSTLSEKRKKDKDTQ